MGANDMDPRANDPKFKKKMREFAEKILPLIGDLKTDFPNGGTGETICPICHKNLRWSIAEYNGHIALACETEGCVRMRE